MTDQTKICDNELDLSNVKIAVLIPCHNEELSVEKVIKDFKKQLPKAKIYVFNNCSDDKTADIAAEQGATVINEPRKGKGFVVESMFNRINADIYIMADGDDTYPADCVHELIKPVLEDKADMAIGTRLSECTGKSFRFLHRFGNNLVRGLINFIFKTKLTDIMSGYRVFNRKVVEQIPIISSGFEVETEMTIQMLHYKLKMIEIKVPYRARMEGSQSKLNTLSDGWRVLWKIFSLFRAYKPLTFFGGIGIVVALLGVLAGAFPIYDYITKPDHHIEHVPMAILAIGLVALSASFVLLGIILHAVTKRFLELHNVLTRKKYS